MTNRVPLILLPGLLCDEALYAHQITHLADMADMRVADLTRHDSIEEMARAVLDAAPDRFSLLGLSMGGYVAQHVALMAPDRVARLALLDTNARSDNDEQRARRRGLIELAQKGQFKGVTDRLLPLLVHDRHLENTQVVETVKAMAQHVGKEAFLRQQAALLGRADQRDRLGEIRCPTLVLCGREDKLSPVKVHAEMHRLLPISKLVVVEDCGHLPPLEQSVATTAVLRYWLQEIAGMDRAGD